VISPEIMARVAWNYLVEPGDRVAGLLIGAIGPEAAMARVLSDSTEPLDELSSVELRNAFDRWQPRLVPGKASELLKEAHRRGVFPITPADSDWPEALTDLGVHSPLILWGRGERSALESLGKSVSIVGSRTVTSYGNWATTEIVSHLTELGVATVSGGALGVDAIVHRSSLRFGGVTIGVMAGGLFNPYPAGNLELFDQIGQSGLLLSEMAPDAKPTRWRFLQRNRLIAALGKAVIVTEAGYRSGSINTVNHALDLDRPVFALPGPVNSPNSAGCNRLIAEGKAQVITDFDDLEVQLGLRTEVVGGPQLLGQLELRLLDALTNRFQDEGRVAALAGFTTGELRMAIGGLELLGLMKRDGQMLAKTT
jgi:DNA processing protein